MHGQDDDVLVQHLVVAQVVRQRRRRAARLRGHEDRGARARAPAGLAATAAMNSSSGTARAVRRSATSRRPVFHVVISVNSTPPITSGSQPPCDDLQQVGAEERQVDGQEDAGDGERDRRAASFQRSVVTTCSSSAVITIVSVTAMP